MKTDLFSNAEPAHLHHAGRRNLNAYLARINAAGVVDSKLFFLAAFDHILEPNAERDRPVNREVTVESLVMLKDYFDFAGDWMRKQFDIKPVGQPDHWHTWLTYTKERWEQWKRSLEALAEGRDLTLRFSARNALDAMG